MSAVWTEADDQKLRELHGTASIKEIANRMNRSPGSVRGRITRLGIAKRTLWTAEEELQLSELYRAAGATGFLDLESFAKRIGRDAGNVCRKAISLGLQTSACRKKVSAPKIRAPKYSSDEDRRAASSKRVKEWIAANGHPRGMAGKSHAPGVMAAANAASRARWDSLTEDEKSESINKALRAKVEKYGCIAPNVQRGNWKAGWREIGGRRIYFRSRWEANYARYLEWLRCNGQIACWDHEPETFWFEAIRRGVRSYLPDFLVTETGGSKAYHEVKGWMDSRSKTTIRRFRKYYPQHTLIVVDGPAYRAIERKASSLIGGWE